MGLAVEATSWSERLREAGLRVTQRVAVLHVVHAEPHISADQISQRVRAQLGTVSTQAVWDTLNTLTEHRILRCFEPAGSSLRFEIRVEDNHHHLACRRFGAVSDVPCVAGGIPCAVPADTRGYAIDEAEVIYWGLCASCHHPIPARGPHQA